MATHVAFLRAINLGAVRKFPKEAIVAATESAGFAEVATHINTGNVALTTRMRSCERIEATLERAYAADRGFDVPTVVLSAAEMLEVVTDADELAGGHAGKHYVWFMKTPPAADDVERLVERAAEGEHIAVRGRVVHLLIGENLMDSVAAARVEKTLGVGTARNSTVVRAVTAKWCSAR